MLTLVPENILWVAEGQPFEGSALLGLLGSHLFVGAGPAGDSRAATWIHDPTVLSRSKAFSTVWTSGFPLVE